MPVLLLGFAIIWEQIWVQRRTHLHDLPNWSSNLVKTLSATRSLQPFWMTSFSHQKSLIAKSCDKNIYDYVTGIGLTDGQALWWHQQTLWGPNSGLVYLYRTSILLYEIDDLTDNDLLTILTILTRQIYNWQPNNVSGSLPREQSSWGQHGAHLGPVGPRWANMSLAIRVGNYLTMSWDSTTMNNQRGEMV